MNIISIVIYSTTWNTSTADRTRKGDRAACHRTGHSIWNRALVSYVCKTLLWRGNWVRSETSRWM